MKNKINLMILTTVLIFSSIPVAASRNNGVIARPKAVNEYNIYTFNNLNKYPKLNNVLRRSPTNIKINIMDKNGEIKDVTRFIKYPIRSVDGRTAVAITDITKMFNVQVNWFQKEKMIVLGNIDKFRASNGNEYVKLVYIPLQKGVIQVDDTINPIEIPALVDPTLNKTYLPIRSTAELLDYEVNWNNTTKTVTLFPKV